MCLPEPSTLKFSHGCFIYITFKVFKGFTYFLKRIYPRFVSSFTISCFMYVIAHSLNSDEGEKHILSSPGEIINPYKAVACRNEASVKHLAQEALQAVARTGTCCCPCPTFHERVLSRLRITTCSTVGK